MDTAIRFQHVTLQWKNFTMRDLSFSIPKGYLTVLLGKNGSGKTTLLQLILNQYPAYEGTILVNGLDIRKENLRIKDSIALISESNSFFRNKNAIDNAEIYAPFYSKFDKEYYLAKLKELKVSISTPVGKLSKGTYIKFQLAFAMAHAPSLYLMDEPTAGLDPVYRRDFAATIQKLLEDETTSILMSSHITEDFDRTADFIMLLNNGQLEFLQDRESLSNDWRRKFGSDHGFKLATLMEEGKCSAHELL